MTNLIDTHPAYVAGTWKLATERERATLTLSPFARLAKRDAAALEEEGCQQQQDQRERGDRNRRERAERGRHRRAARARRRH